uniref:Uncharacterized protein n=1 Tax=Colletotrichum fructicola (strain Nara gc5) TaxID=1213859 RepID=L2GEF8_COLFN
MRSSLVLEEYAGYLVIISFYTWYPSMMLTLIRANLEDDFDYLQIQKRTSDSSFFSIIHTLEPLYPSTDYHSQPLVLYESYVGAVLGGQFQLGRLTRHEKFADVYEVTPLVAEDIPPMEAMVYDFRGCSVTARKRDVKLRRPFSICEIDQGGKKYLVYYVDSKLSYDREKQKRKKRRNRLKSVKENKSRRVGKLHQEEVAQTSPYEDSAPDGHEKDTFVPGPTTNACHTKKIKTPTQTLIAGEHCADERELDSETRIDSSDASRCVEYRSFQQEISNIPRLKGKATRSLDIPNRLNTSTSKCPWRVSSSEFNSMELEGCVEFEELIDFDNDLVFADLSYLRKEISRLSINYRKLEARLGMSVADSEFVPSGLKSLREVTRQHWMQEFNKLPKHIRNLEGRAWLWHELQKESDDIRRLVCFMEDHLEVNAHLPDLELILGMEPAITRQTKYQTWTKSKCFLAYLNSIHSKRPKALSRVYKELAETMNYGHSMYLKNLWESVTQLVKEGQADEFAEALIQFHIFESTELTIVDSWVLFTSCTQASKGEPEEIIGQTQRLCGGASRSRSLKQDLKVTSGWEGYDLSWTRMRHRSASVA